MSERRVVVTGMGEITPVGKNVQENWNSLVNGKSGISIIKRFDVSNYSSQVGGEVDDFNPSEYGIGPKKARKIDLFVQFALAAAKEAYEQSGLDMDKESPSRCGAIIGSGIGGLNTIEREYKKMIKRGPKRVSPFLIPAMIIDMASGQVSIEYGLQSVNYGVVSACASGAHAIGNAMRMVRNGDSDVIFTGGSEASISPLGLAGFCSARALSTRNDEPEKASRPFDARRDGFVMSEGAGIVILEELEHAKKRGAEILAEVTGYGATADAYHITAPEPRGKGGVKAVKLALEDAGINAEDIDYINAHGTSTPLNDKVETQVIKAVFEEHSGNVPISSTKSMTGHLLGAAGAVELISCIKSINNGIIHPTINYENPDPDCDLDYVPNKARECRVEKALSNSLGFGGHNATLIVERFSG